MDSARLANATEFIVEPVSQYGKDGEHVVAIVKSTWVLAPPRASRPPELVLAPAEMQRGVRHADVHWGDPTLTSVCYPADCAMDKSGTDVVLVADACAAGGEAAIHIDVKATIGPLEVMLRAHGPRVWTSNGTGLTSPRATARVPLRWELAFGGRDEVEPGVFVEEPRNPVGRGIAAEPEKLDGTPGPQIEAVEAPVRSIEDAPVPAGVGAVGRHWEPRRTHMGTYDAAWLDGRAPLVPRDEDPRHALFAAPGLHAGTAFAGGEAIRAAMAAATGEPAGWVLSDTAYEALRVREWEMTQVRVREQLGVPYRWDALAQRIGRTGAAQLPLAAALVAASFAVGHIPSPSVLAIAGTDAGRRSAVWMRAIEPRLVGAV